ncbi:metal ABC transporter solute-binding protein, Zn/Mn family [Bacillus sp. AK128]
MKRLSISLIFLLSISVFLAGCNQTEEQVETTAGTNETTESTLQVYTTIYPLEYFAKRIGGDLIEVNNIIPPGADGHTYEPTAKTMVEVAEADAFIYSGAGIEGFADAMKEALKNEDVKIIAAAEGVELLTHSEEEHAHEEEVTHDEHDDHVHEDEATHDEHDDHAHEDEATHDEHDDHAHEDEATHDEHDDHAHEDEASHNHGDLDPHVWLDPLLAIQLSENILHVLEELKPEAKADFEKNFQTLKQELEALDQEFKETISQSAKKEIIVSHAAYGYWEARYGIEQISISGLSPTNEPSQQELTKIIETAKEHDIKHVLFEQNVSTKIAEIIRTEINAEALTLHNLEALSEEDYSEGKDYFNLMKENLDTLKTALN